MSDATAANGWAEPTFAAVLGGLGSHLVDSLRVTLSDAWDGLTPEEKQACTTLLVTIARARLYELAGRPTHTFLPTLEVAFENWEVVGKQVVVDGVRRAAVEGLGLGGAFVGSAVAAFLKASAK